MNKQQIYELKWYYDYWADIEKFCPIGSTITCKTTRIQPSYAFLKTKEGLICFLSKDKVSTKRKFADLTLILSSDIEYTCTVLSYDLESSRLVIALNLNH